MPKLYLRPFAKKNLYQFTPINVAAKRNWLAIDETTPNDLTDYNYGSNTFPAPAIALLRDNHRVKDLTGSLPTIGTINYIKLRYRVKRGNSSSGSIHQISVGIAHPTSGAWYDAARSPTSFTTYTAQLNTKPAGFPGAGSAWTWSDLLDPDGIYMDYYAELAAGTGPATTAEIWITWYEIEVDYNIAIAPAVIDIGVDAPAPTASPIIISPDPVDVAVDAPAPATAAGTQLYPDLVDISVDAPAPTILGFYRPCFPGVASREPGFMVADRTPGFVLAIREGLAVESREPSFALARRVTYEVTLREPNFLVEECDGTDN